MTNLTSYLMDLERREQTEPKVTRKKEIEVRAEISKIENRRKWKEFGGEVAGATGLWERNKEKTN